MLQISAALLLWEQAAKLLRSQLCLLQEQQLIGRSKCSTLVGGFFTPETTRFCHFAFFFFVVAKDTLGCIITS